jgi:GTP-binding protein
MRKPLVAIVGRPNVGKSTLFNRIIGERRAIVEDIAGTTRDRMYAEADWNGVPFDVIDTGGLQDEQEIAASTSLEISESTQRQALFAIEEADLLLFLVDGEIGVTAGDHDVADLVRRSGVESLLVVNKTESRTRQDAAVDFYELGLGEPIPVSSLHGMGVGDLLDVVVARIPKVEVEEAEDLPSIAIVGRPNVGKSAILNALTGDARHIVSEVPGTTRDAIDTELNWAGQRIRLIDTAGIRRRGRIDRGIETFSVIRSFRAIERCDVAVLVLDATEPFTSQDQHVAGFVADAKKGIILVVNKWDLIEKDNKTMSEFMEKAGEAFEFLPYAPIIFTSALTGQRLDKIMETALSIMTERSRRIPTGELNKLLREVIVRHSPPTKPGKWLKIYYVTQAATEPPTFVFFVNAPENVHFSYRRCLENTLRDDYGFTGTPIVIRIRGRGPDE